MTALLLRLAAPLQSWGTSSRFTRRATDRVPSKSGVIGLLAAAQGRRRTDPLEDLLGLGLAVRTEQPGTLQRDFQTAARTRERTPVSVSTRHYLADAVFLAAIEGDPALLDGLSQALREPCFPLYLGRRSCPPVGPIAVGVREGDAVAALRAEPWHAAAWFQRTCREPHVRLDLVADCPPDYPDAELVRDEPLSFDPQHRQWEWRAIRRHTPVSVDNPTYVGDHHDPMTVV
jgi:CRISPR system Cascade subunit CasD